MYCSDHIIRHQKKFIRGRRVKQFSAPVINYDIKILYKNHYIKNILLYLKYNLLLLMLKMPLWVRRGRDVSHDCATTECF